MKKWKVSELFSQLSIPAEELPEIRSNDEISAKNVKSRVLAKIENTEVITTAEPKRKDMTKRLMLGLGIAAALVAGGVGAYSSSDVGSRVKENPTHATIDSKPMQIMTEETMLSSGTSVSSAASGSTASGSAAAETEQVIKAAEVNDETQPASHQINPPDERYSPTGATYEDFKNTWQLCKEEVGDELYITPYKVEIMGSMDILEVVDTRIYTDGPQCRVQVTFDASLPDGLTPADIEFGLGTGAYFIDTQYGLNGGVAPEMTVIDDDTFSITYIEYNTTVNAMENAYCLTVDGVQKKGAQTVSELGMKNLLGFTGAEIAANTPVTEEQLAQFEEEYVWMENQNAYMKKSDILDTNRLQIYIDPSEREYPVGLENTENYTRCEISNSTSYSIDYAPEFEDTLSMINAEIHTMESKGNNAVYVIKYTGKNGFEFTGDEDMTIFANAKLQPYVIDENGYLDFDADIEVRSDTWVDINGVTNGGTACMYQKITMSTIGIPEMYLRLSLGNLMDRENRSIIDVGQITSEMYIPFYDTMSVWSGFTDSFTTPDGFDVDIRYTGNEAVLTWQGAEGSMVPEFMCTGYTNDYTNIQPGTTTTTDDNFTFIMDNGFRYRSRMALIVDDSRKVCLTIPVRSGWMMGGYLESIEFEGNTFYTKNG